MKITTLLYGVFMWFSFTGCKVHREVQKQSSRTDSTATSSKEVAKGSTLLQQHKNNRLESSHTIGQNQYRKQTKSYQFAPDTNNSSKGNVSGLFSPALEKRLIGITETTEEGTQATQTGSLTRQNSDLLNIAKDSIKSEEKKNTVVNKAAAAKQSVTTRKVGNFAWWLIILIILILLAIWKRRPIVLLIKAIIRVIRNGMPNTPA